MQNADTHHSKEVMCSVGMVIDTTEERRSRILATVSSNEVGASRMLMHERGDIMDESGYEDEWASSGLFLD